ncbi:MAG: hypothetical protein M5R36_09670 [Deltaproteobacteria bacterium]|nr:hypothetical protein [Deltaproteobacteria bacterium]
MRGGDLFCHVDGDFSVFPCPLTAGRVPAMSARERGFAAAFRAANRAGCEACCAGPLVERNLLFAAGVAAIRHTLRGGTRRT